MDIEIINKSYYAIIPANVRYDNRLKAKAKLLYAELTCLTNEKGFCWATNQYFANLYSINKSTVSKLLSQLKEYGYINIELIRNKETKQVEKRIITLLTNSPIGIVKNDNPPMGKKDSKEYYKYSNIIKEYYNSKNCFPKIIKMTKNRKEKMVSRLEEIGYEEFIRAIDIASKSKFLTGKNDKKWKMDFDWLVKNDNNIMKVLEGKYSDIEETKSIIYQILDSNEILKEIPKKMEDQVDDVTVEYRIYYNKLEPIIYTRINESHIELSLRYLVHPKKIRIVQNEIYLKILKEYKKGNIDLYKE